MAGLAHQEVAPVITVLVAPEDFDRQELSIEGDTYRHLFRARRLGLDASLRLVDGAGHARAGSIVEIGASQARVRNGKSLSGNEARIAVALFVASPTLDRAGWLVEKATEVGVHSIRFVPAERARRPLTDGALARLRRRACSAVEQSHRSRVPRVEVLASWSAALECAAGNERVEFLTLRDASTPVADASEPVRSVGVFIGPEGGWSEPEERQLAALPAVAVHFGRRVLRTETAALVAAARWLC